MAGIKVQGTNLADLLNGSSDNDTIVAGAGNDTIIGGSGSDILWGGLGADTFVYGPGETGNDQIRDFDVSMDAIDVSALGLTSLAQATAGASIGTNGVVLQLGGQTATLFGVMSLADLSDSNFIFASSTPAGVKLQGTARNDVLVGSAGADTIVAGAGNDTITGGSGSDVLWGGAGSDTFVLKAGDTGIDQLRDFNVDQDAIDVSALGINSLSQALANATVGPKGLILGFDTQSVVLYGVSSADQLSASNFVFASSTVAGQKIQGTAQADNIVGSAGADTIVAGAGNDSITGGSGSDVLWGGAGSDVFIYRAGETGNDQLRDFDVTADRIDVSALGIASFAAAIADATVGPKGVTLDFGTQTATLFGVNSVAELSASNFILV